ncbi:hypothetical protein GTO27_04105, partial [Candidatus Bathyarchaeota archaeon]|nr:hypothetical protein [Candidatus Bathyarchaeota archaeon]
MFGPKTDEEWEIWRQTVVNRLMEHFATEAVSSDLAQSFFSYSAGKGLALFDLLSRRYDTVVANPPYLGDKKFGSTLKALLRRSYPDGWKDLVASFAERQM